MYTFPNLEPVCTMSSSNFCFLTCIQISQKAGQVAWCSHLFKNFPEFVVIHTVKGFGVVSKVEVDIFFWNCLAFSMIQWMLAIWSLVPLPFLNTAWTFGISQFKYCWSPAWRSLSITLFGRWVHYAVVWTFFGIALLWDWNEYWRFPVLGPLLSLPNLLAYGVQHFHSIILQDLK